VERGHDHLERRLAREARVRVDRNAAAVVGDGQAIAGRELDLDPGGKAGDRFVHAIVDDLGGEVVKRPRIGAADVHAGAAADGLEPFENLDRGCVVILGSCRGVGREKISHLPLHKARIQAVPMARSPVFHSS